MMRRNISKFAIAAFVTLIILSVTYAFAANISVPSTRLTRQTSTITVNDLIPAECDSIRSLVTTLVVCGGGACSGTNADELILGTSGDDEIDGKNGADCIVGGSGNDDLNGGNGDDVLVGGDGDDILDGGPKKDYDICYGGSGNNSLSECDLP